MANLASISIIFLLSIFSLYGCSGGGVTGTGEGEGIIADAPGMNDGFPTPATPTPTPTPTPDPDIGAANPPTFFEPSSTDLLYNNQQTACATDSYSREATGDSTLSNAAFSSAILIRGGSNQELIFSNTENLSVLFGLLAIQEAGTLIIEHIAGPPSDSVLTLHERRLDDRLFQLVGDDDSGAGFRARIEVNIDVAGGYCFLVQPFSSSPPLPSLGASDDGTTDTVLIIQFAR